MMRRTTTFLLAATATAFVVQRPVHAQAQPAAQPAQSAQLATAGARVDSLFRRWHTPDSPGAAVLVVRNGEVVHARGYGMANLEHGVPIGAHTVFDIASVSKQFGAMAIALLEADGRLSLDDDVRKYIPELHDFGHRITLRHLVHHTSGIRDWPGTMRIGGWSYHDVISFEQILRFAFNQRELNFRPGEAYAYSNTGYNLLAEVVRRVSGMSFRQFTEQRIFAPLGMRNTHFHDDHATVVRNRAESYRPGADGSYFIVPNSLTALGSSSLFTSIEDMARWIGNFDKPVIGGSAVVQRMHERGVLNGGDTIPYAFGQNVAMSRGLRTVNHSGSWAGYRTILQRYPDEGLSIAIFANTTEMNTGQLATRIAEIYLGERLVPVAAPPTAPTNAPATAGSRWTPSTADLRAYEGRYESSELLTSWELAVVGNRLVATHFRGGETALQPIERDRFQSGVFGEVRFTRDRAGRVTGFTANSDRVRGLKFVNHRER
jgi:CubicO group peptidase (beta-lactamase class C family)